MRPADAALAKKAAIAAGISKIWASWVANAKWKSEADRINAMSAVGNQDPRATASSISYLKMQAVLRMVVLKVMYENQVDVFVNPEQTRLRASSEAQASLR